MSHKNYSARPLDYNEPLKPKLKAQGINVKAIEKENNSNIKYVEAMTGPKGLEVANSEIISLTGEEYLPSIGNTIPSVQDISEYNPIPKAYPKPQAPTASTIVDNEIVTPTEATPAEELPVSIEEPVIANKEDKEINDISDVSNEIDSTNSKLESL